MKDLQKRKLPRLKNYNYSQNGYYFITICTENKKCILANIVWNGQDHAESTTQSVGNGLDRSVKTKLTQYGEIDENELLNIPLHFEFIKIDKYYYNFTTITQNPQ